MQRTTCCLIFAPALPEYPAASVRDYCSGAYTLDDLSRQVGLTPQWKGLLRDLDRLAQVRIRLGGANWLVRTDASPAAARLFKTVRLALPRCARQAKPRRPLAPPKRAAKRRGRPRRSATTA